MSKYLPDRPSTWARPSRRRIVDEPCRAANVGMAAARQAGAPLASLCGQAVEAAKGLQSRGVINGAVALRHMTHGPGEPGRADGFQRRFDPVLARPLPPRLVGRRR